MMTQFQEVMNLLKTAKSIKKHCYSQ